MYRKMILQAIVTLLRALGRVKVAYPKRMYNKTKADFIAKMKDHNKGDNQK